MSSCKCSNFAVFLQSSASGVLPLGESTDFHGCIEHVFITMMEVKSTFRVGPADNTNHVKASCHYNPS